MLDLDHETFARECAIDIPGPETEYLGKLASQWNAFVMANEGSYPENARGLAMNGAEVVYRGPYPHPHVGNGLFEIQNRARALDNNMYLIACNVGTYYLHTDSDVPIYPKNLYLDRAPYTHGEYRRDVIDRQVRLMHERGTWARPDDGSPAGTGSVPPETAAGDQRPRRLRSSACAFVSWAPERSAASSRQGWPPRVWRRRYTRAARRSPRSGRGG